MKQIKTYFKFLFLICLISCGKVKDTTVTDDVLDANKVFFNVVYNTTLSRTEGSTQFFNVEGKQRIQFIQNDATNASGGTFTVFYEIYKEPQLYGTSYCSGNYKGDFTVTQQSGTTTTTTTEGVPYDPSNPYVSPVAEEIETTNSAYFLFNLTVTSKSTTMSNSVCANVRPLASLTLKIVRFPNGDIQVTNTDRGMEFYMIPEVL